MAATDLSILLPHRITQNAQDDPSGLFARIPVGPKYTDGYKDVSKLQFEDAINQTAFLIEQSLGKSSTFETLAYIGPQDLRYSIVVVAGVKVGYKVFLPSPRNSKEAHISLLEKLQCTKLIATEPYAPCVPSILGALDLQAMTLPSLQYLLDMKNGGPYPYSKSFTEAKNEPAFVLHTSGSTGIPKHLTFTHDFISRVVAACSLLAPDGHADINQYFNTGKFLMTLPSFHIAGLAYSLLVPTYLGSTPVYTLPGPPPTTESFIEAINNTDIQWAFVPPVVIDELGKNPDLLNVVASRLKYLFFTGGSVPKASGDVVAEKLPIWQVLGSSECASLPLIHSKNDYKNSQAWNYLQMNPRLKSEMRHRFDDLYELVIVRNPETDGFQPVFAHFPETTEYATRDLFKPHPTKQGLWAHQGRIDDVIVFLNGEKTNPVTFEEEIISHPEVRAALVIGSQRIEAALLIELVADVPLTKEATILVIDRIWPLVETANRAAPAHARVSRDKILIADPGKPMLRAGKGTVQRKATLELYAKEIERLYQQEIGANTKVGEHSKQNDIKSIIRDLVADMLGLDDLDFFQSGIDSLGVLRLQRTLSARFPNAKISPNTVYSNASINALTQALEKSIMEDGETSIARHFSTKDLAKMLEEFAAEIDAIGSSTSRPEAPSSCNERPTLLLTGSTGALGSYILENLLSKPEVSHVYCVNRSSDAKDRQIHKHQARGLDITFPPDKVTFLAGDIMRHNFGLSEDIYQTLLSEVTHIVHNAWPVNFNLSMTAFRPSISGLVSLVRFTKLSRCNSALFFFSSISSVSSCPMSIVPEAIVTDMTAPAAMGYGQSKYLAERILDHASKALGVRATVIRIGQVAGAARTASGWNRHEWLPSLVTSSAFIGAIPATLGEATSADEIIDWVPIDQVADVVVELALNSDATVEGERYGPCVFNIVHPRPVSWSSLILTVKKTLEASNSPLMAASMRVVPYQEWISILKTKVLETETAGGIDVTHLVRLNPAMKLLGFFEDMQYQGSRGLRTRLSIEKALSGSKALRELESLKDEWIIGWLNEWIDSEVN